MNAWKLWENPLIVRGIRSRLRPQQAISWGLVTIVACTFLYIFVSKSATQHTNTTPAEASREAIVPLLVLQGVILMVMGTGAVAGGMARERTYRLLDYQRLTPMRPGAKILGMLIGLPIREYCLFALTLPFVFYAAWVGGMSFVVLLQFYVVFISSAVVYHMTGLVAGMIVDKPWRAGTVSQGLIFLLYLALPQISNAGFTFFEHLTARPVFYGLVMEHIVPENTLEGFVADIRYQRFEAVDFFGMKLMPTYFSLAVQAFALVSLYVIVYRKWLGDWKLPFSKGYALLFFAVAQFFLVGSVQPYLRSDRLFGMLTETASDGLIGRSPTLAVFIVLFITQAVSGVVAALVLHLCTPTWHQSVLALRRANKRGNARLLWTDDSASSLPVAIACGLMSCLSFIAVYQSAVQAERITVSNTPAEVATMLLLFAAVLIVVQQVREQFTERVFVMALFVFWVVPFLSMIVLWAGFGRSVAGLYAAVPFPAAAFWSGTAMLVSDLQGTQDREMVPVEMVSHTQTIVWLTVMLYSGAALSLLLAARRRWQRIHNAAKPGQQTAETLETAPDAEPIATPVPAYARSGE